ncbi:MAG: transporter binding protein [Nitrosarchaeum sp.]|nr:transporter binding protein [Nitrosarchaeum sp.]
MTESAIVVKNLSKKFRIYHERRNTVYEIITSFFNKKKYYEELTILDNVSFEVNKGEIFGIIGRNGTGKTTLLRLLSQIYKPDSGSIKINGSLVPFLSLGAGFQLEMTASDNVILYGKLLGFSKKEIKNKLEEIIKFAELEKFADTKLKNFSSGMYARLAFATAVQVNPDIILMDEILSVGDIGFQKKSHDTFVSFKEKGKTIVLVSHDLKVIRENCDRVMFLNEGKIVDIGDPEQVIKTYVKIFNQ